MQSFALPLAALSFAAAPSAPSGQAASKEIDRSHIDDKYKWKLGDLYASDQAWAKAKAALAKKVAGFERHKGHLGEGAKALADALAELGRCRTSCSGSQSMPCAQRREHPAGQAARHAGRGRYARRAA